MKIFYSCLLSIILIAFNTQANNITPDVWGGYSIATSEDLDVFTYNPAGIAINHGTTNRYFMGADQCYSGLYNASRLYVLRSWPIKEEK